MQRSFQQRPSRMGSRSRFGSLAVSSLKVDSLLRLGTPLGEGSFGQAMVGYIQYQSEETKVVMKRYKKNCEKLGRMELKMNQHVSALPGVKRHCAEYIGFSEVEEGAGPPDMTPGLWLVWKYEGSKTLSHYLKTGDPIASLSTDMNVDKTAVVATVAKQLFEGLKALHGAGLVHRDVKPHNMVLDEQRLRFKFIDLGACADLRTGKNFVPTMSIMDRSYCPPELYVLPTDSPNIAKNMFNLAMGPIMWMKHKPDRFDMWSAGIILLQFMVPSMRTSQGLKKFNATFGPKYNYSLKAWRRNSLIPRHEFELLDGDDGAGWELISSLLQPRNTQASDKGIISFQDKVAPRISADEALRHRFLKAATSAPLSGTTKISVRDKTRAAAAAAVPVAAAAAAANRSSESTTLPSSSTAWSDSSARVDGSASTSTGTNGTNGYGTNGYGTTGTGTSAGKGTSAGTSGTSSSDVSRKSSGLGFLSKLAIDALGSVSAALLRSLGDEGARKGAGKSKGSQEPPN